MNEKDVLKIVNALPSLAIDISIMIQDLSFVRSERARAEELLRTVEKYLQSEDRDDGAEILEAIREYLYS